MWRPLGLTEDDLAHWSAAEQADYSSGGHGDMTLKILAEHCSTEAEQARVLEVLAETMQVRSYHFDQIGRESLAAAGASDAA